MSAKISTRRRPSTYSNPFMDGRAQAGMKYEIGKPVAVHLTDGAVLRGFVHAKDRGATLLCLELIPSAQVAFVSTHNVKSVSQLAHITAARKWPTNFTVDFAKIRAQERRAYERSQLQFSKLGVGVSSATQAIFDTLSKTLSCAWEGEVIVILDAARLAPPYNSKCISGDIGVGERVKMILERESSTIRNATDVNGERL